MTGTARYASMNTHLGIGTCSSFLIFTPAINFSGPDDNTAYLCLSQLLIELLFCDFTEQSRRDDLESLGFVLMYFLRGR